MIIALGSIPAWAGKPDDGTRTIRSGQVYPRVGGETNDLWIGRRIDYGLSPRGRGNPPSHNHSIPAHGSIPAWAGKPIRRYRNDVGAGVYPRVGGETSETVCSHPSLMGLSPRGRGNQLDDGAELCRQGLSPRGRGNRRVPSRTRRLLRSIPAWAGKPSTRCSTRSSKRVYPRVGGETSFHDSVAEHFGGLSPRGRGNPPSMVRGSDGKGSIPAWAGKPARRPTAEEDRWVYPRVGGETPMTTMANPTMYGLSPRGRGNLDFRYKLSSKIGSIPAWAGKPSKTTSYVKQ